MKAWTNLSNAKSDGDAADLPLDRCRYWSWIPHEQKSRNTPQIGRCQKRLAPGGLAWWPTPPKRGVRRTVAARLSVPSSLLAERRSGHPLGGRIGNCVYSSARRGRDRVRQPAILVRQISLHLLQLNTRYRPPQPPERRRGCLRRISGQKRQRTSCRKRRMTESGSFVERSPPPTRKTSLVLVV